MGNQPGSNPGEASLEPPQDDPKLDPRWKDPEFNTLHLEPDCMGLLFWEFNCVLQFWNQEDGVSYLCYMPRKHCAAFQDDLIPHAELPAVARNNAKVLRNLASLCDTLADGKIDTVYYPDELPTEAIADYEEEKLSCCEQQPEEDDPRLPEDGI